MTSLYFYKNKSLVTLILLLLTSLALMFMNVKLSLFNIRSPFFFLTYPVEFVAKGVSDLVENTVNGIGRIHKLEEQLNSANKRLLHYQEKLLLYSQVVSENETLKRQLGLKGILKYESTYARVVYRDPNLTADYLIINKGTLDGLRRNMPVVSSTTNGELFLLGKVIEVNLTASKVKLLTAADFYVGVSVRNKGYVGILRGNGSWNQNLVVDYIPQEADIRVGDSVITSGESDIFPFGLPVGRVTAIGKSSIEEFFQKLYLKPLYSYSIVKNVFIVDWHPSAEIKDLIESSYE